MEELLKEIIEGKKVYDKENNHGYTLGNRGIGSKSYMIKRIDLLREKLLEIKKELK